MSYYFHYLQSSELFCNNMNERRADSITKKAAICLLAAGILKFFENIEKTKKTLGMGVDSAAR